MTTDPYEYGVRVTVGNDTYIERHARPFPEWLLQTYPQPAVNVRRRIAEWEEVPA